jgi:hypothetical protein
MADYYSLLERMIKEALDDPARVRQVVYEATRLALKREVLLQQPPITIQEGRRLLNDLEDAIARCEADFAESGRQKSNSSRAHETRETESGRIRGYDHGGEGDDAIISTAPEDRKAGGSDGPRTNGKGALAESQEEEEEEEAAQPAYDRRMRGDPHSALRANRQDRGPIELDEDNEPGVRPSRAARERRKTVRIDARGANGRYALDELEEDEARTTQARPTSDRPTYGDLRSGFRAADHYHREPGHLDEDDEAVVRTNRAGRNGSRASVTHAPRASSRSPFAEFEEDESPPMQASPTKDRRTGRRMDGESRADRYDRAKHVNADDRSDPHQDGLVERPTRQRSRFKDPPRRQEDWNSTSRELVVLPDRSYLVRPDALPPRADIIYEVPPHPLKGFVPLIWSGARILFQVTVAALAATAFYVTVWQRNIGQPARDAPASMTQDKGPPGNPNSAAPVAGSGGGETAAAAALAPAMQPAPADAAFPYPTSYGVYAISNNQLIELEQVPTGQVDPRTRSLLQIVKPSRTIILDAHLTFIAFRRDLVSSAPDKVPVRIAARIAHSMIFDSSGKPVVTTPETETWLIRDQGYDLRVAPVRGNAEMVMLRSDDPDFAFPAGRYELLLGGQHYDFVVAGAVLDPAQCVEGFATVRGPAFNECKPQ